jgi:hypothetical protein
LCILYIDKITYTVNMNESSGIGQRIADSRKRAGFSSTTALAHAIPNANITASVLQNIESGRSTNISITQWLDISRALGISPVAILVDIFDPTAKVDVPNIGEQVANMSSAEVIAWFNNEAPPETAQALIAQATLRNLRMIAKEVARYRAVMALAESAGQSGVENSKEYLAPLLRAAAKFLLSEGVNLSWAQDVLDDLEINK